MQLPVCNFDLESDMLCTSCQAKLDRGEITSFDIELSKWLLEREKDYPNLENVSLLRSTRIEGRLILIVKKKGKDLFLAEEALVNELSQKFGEVMVVEGPPKLRRVIREFIHPASEVGVNSLYLPDGSKESIVILREQDRERIQYSTTDLRLIVSGIMGESVLFEYQEDRVKAEKEEEAPDEFDQRMEELSNRRSRKR
jgi:transcription antitermination factor NusA-like protein